MLVYLETTVLLSYTLTKSVEPERYKEVSALIRKINTGAIEAVTSFYALHEVVVFAVQMAGGWRAGSIFAKQALCDILSSRILITSLLPRLEKVQRARLFPHLPDRSDIDHATAMSFAESQIMVSYDTHFDALPSPFCRRTPEQILALTRA